MCKVLNISRSIIYHIRKGIIYDSKLENLIINIFRKSRNNYGTRKIKKELEKANYNVSRRKIGQIMKKYTLISSYTVKQYKVHKTSCNEEKIKNVVNREFDSNNHLDIVVSDLTYVNVNGKWNYICILIDLFNREIVGYAAGKNKDAGLVNRAFGKVSSPLSKINIFHTDRGNEFKNKIIDDLLKTFKITRSLSKKGCPYDNAVAEATFKVIKTEFTFNRNFNDFEELELSLFDYVNWYNNERIHGSLGYLTPVAYKNIMIMSEKKLS